MITQPKTFTSRIAICFAALSVCGTAPAAFGAISYRYATDVSTLNLLPGQHGSVNLYLVETVTDGSVSRFATEGGLSSAYVGVSYVAPNPPAGPLANPSTIFSISANVGEFNDLYGPDEPVAGDHMSAYILEYVDIEQPTGPSGVEISTGVRRVFLGTVEVVGGLSGGTTTFRVADNPATNDIVTIDGFASAIDAGPITPATFDVIIPIPEPTAAGILALVMAGPFLTTRVRRERSVR